LRVVIDPNVLVSAAISPAGATAAIVGLIDAGAITAIVSSRLLTELGGVLRREKFRTWLGLDEVAAYVDELERLAELVEDPSEVPIVSPDPDDDYLIALARPGRRGCLGLRRHRPDRPRPGRPAHVDTPAVARGAGRHVRRPGARF
jgi:putative PIN family toxin of toxin-antitoxin system